MRVVALGQWGGFVGGSRFKSQWGQKFTKKKKVQKSLIAEAQAATLGMHLSQVKLMHINFI